MKGKCPVCGHEVDETQYHPKFGMCSDCLTKAIDHNLDQIEEERRIEYDD